MRRRVKLRSGECVVHHSLGKRIKATAANQAASEALSPIIKSVRRKGDWPAWTARANRIIHAIRTLSLHETATPGGTIACRKLPFLKHVLA